jgi:4-hydroxy-tetrahydrodipicolinate synthase
MAVVPYYNKPPQEGLYLHFRSIAEAVELPVILYNIPGRCVINMEPATILRLAHDVENIVALKQANADFSQTATIIDGAPEGFEVLSGDDELTLPMMGLGGAGVISVISHVAGRPFKEMVEAQAAGNHTRALRLHLELMPLMKALFITSNPIMVKKALELQGFPVGGCRLPLIEASEAQTAELERVMRHVGVLD